MQILMVYFRNCIEIAYLPSLRCIIMDTERKGKLKLGLLLALSGLVWSGLAREWGGVGKHSILVVISLPGRGS